MAEHVSTTRDERLIRDRWLRRMAVEVCGQLPDTEADARQVLAYAREIVDRFMEPSLTSEEAARADSSVIRLVPR
jgi:hypothetical protein